MKNLVGKILELNKATVMAVFGSARLMVHLDGTLEIMGGTPSERSEAREWLSLFVHNAVLRSGRGPDRAAA